MALVLRLLEGNGGEREIPAEKPFFMGRGTDNDWVLDDPAREISKVHCRIDREGRAHVLTDMSINGVHLEREGRLLGRGNGHRLAVGDVFAVGPHRFAVLENDEARHTALAIPASVPDRVGDILGGHGSGEEARASAALAGEAQGWLSEVPLNAAAAGLAKPLGWDDPPATSGNILPADFDGPASHLANTSEHVPASAGTMLTPKPTLLLPVDWLEDAAEASTSKRGAAGRPDAASSATAPASDSGSGRRGLAEGARLETAALSELRDPALFVRAGALVRALADGLETLEAAQAAAEHDCGLKGGSEGALWTDFLSTARDPCIKLLVDDDEEALGSLARRFAALADRQRALGSAVADSVAEWDRRLAPAVLADAAVPWFAAGPLGRAILWDRYADTHAALAREVSGSGGTDDDHALTGLIRRAFARRLPDT